MKSRTIAAAVSTAIVFIVLAGIVIQKERLLARGDRVYLLLAPKDPRSLMQGDYMALRYALEDDLGKQLRDTESKSFPRAGTVAVTVDEKGVARKVRLYREGDSLASGEKLLRYKSVEGTLSFGATSFFFQEGKAKVYENARYGEVVVDGDGTSVLVGLRDENLKKLE